jgi:hypothetical protein
MATENYGLNINVQTNAEGSIGSLKKQLREAQAEVQILADKFGATSNEAVNAAKKAAELKDRIGDAKALTDAFNPDAKFKALTSSLSGVAGGFGAVQGAMALFGAESDNVQKTLLKVQSAMALSQGLQAVGESIDSFKQLGAVIKTQVVSAFSTLRGAIIATGVGALAVGLGLLIANFEQVKETINNLFPSLGQFADKVKGIVQSITDWAGFTSQLKRNQEDLKKATEASIFSLDQSIKILQSQDGKEAEVYDLKKQRIKAQISLLTDEKDETIKKKVELNTELAILDNLEQKRKQALRDAEIEEATKQQEYLLKVELDAFDKRQKARAKMSMDAIGPDGLTKKERDQAKKEEADRQKAIDDEAQIVMDKMSNNLGKSLAIKAEALGKEYKQEEDASIAKQKIADIELEAKRAQFQTMTQFIGNLGSAFEQGTAASKTAAIAEIGINTALGYIQGLDIAQKGAKGTGPLAPFTMPIFYASQVLAVITAIGKAKQALSQVKGGGSVSIPSMSSAAPMAPQLPTAQVTQLNQQSINDIGNNAVRAYVVESDVTSSQERITAIRQRARFS